MQMSRLGGSSDKDDMAVAVIPIGSPPTQTVMTLTVEATRRIACLNSRGRSEPGVAMVPAHGREELRWQWLSPSSRFRSSSKPRILLGI
jgi:hypothetical protein